MAEFPLLNLTPDDKNCVHRAVCVASLLQKNRMILEMFLRPTLQWYTILCLSLFQPPDCRTYSTKVTRPQAAISRFITLRH